MQARIVLCRRVTRGKRRVTSQQTVHATLATRARTEARVRRVLPDNTKARPVRTRARIVKKGRTRMRRLWLARRVPLENSNRRLDRGRAWTVRQDDTH